MNYPRDNGLTTKVKWLGSFSESFALRQGVRQGGVLSTHLYKIFVEDQLLELEEKALGLMLGSIYVGATAVADDVIYLSSTPEMLQLMLGVGHRYSQQHHYKIHPTKTKIGVSRLTGTDRNGPKRTFVDTETDFLGTETVFSGYRNWPRRNGTDRNGLSWIPKRTFLVLKRSLVDTETGRDGPERTETDRNGPKRTFVDTETDFLGTETDLSGYQNGLFGYRIVIQGT